MSKAEDRALEAYPSTPNWDERITCMYRGGFIKGYHQAEKDLKLTLEDMFRIDEIISQVYKDSNTCQTKIIYQEVLKQFKDYKLKEK